MHYPTFHMYRFCAFFSNLVIISSSVLFWISLLLLSILPHESFGKVESNIVVKSWRASASEHVYFEILEPTSLAYYYKLSPAKDFGTEFNFTFYSTKLVFSQPTHACSQLTNSRQANGRILAIERGGCSFMAKALTGQEAGALAVIIYDNEPESDVHVSMVDDGTHREVGLPSLFMSGKDGHTIRKTLESLGSDYALLNIPVNLTTNQMYLGKQAPWNLW